MRNAFVLTALVAALSSSGAVAAPDYIQASPRELAKKYGKSLAARVFSDELTASRAARIRDSVAHIPRADCPEDPKFILREVQPLLLDDTEVMWIERFEVACTSPRRRTLLMRKQGEGIEVVPMAPGTTLATAFIQGDAGTIARRAAVADDPDGCQQTAVIETNISDPPAANGAPWDERWTVYACGRMVDVIVSFTPSAGNETKIAAVKDAGRPPAKTSAKAQKDAQQAPANDAVSAKSKDWQDCQWTKRLSEKPDLRIAACERAVAEGKLNKSDLSTAYRWLGDALRVKAATSGLDVFDKFEMNKLVMQAYAKAIESNPEDPETYVRRATVYSRGEIEKTISDFSKAIELGTRDSYPYSVRAEYYRDGGRLDLAVADLTKVIEFSPYRSNYRRRAVLYLAQGDYQHAIADLDAELGLKPSKADQATNYILRAIASQRSGDLKQAFADFAKSESLIRNSTILRYHRGVALTEAGDYEEAVDEFSKVIDSATTTVGTLKDPLADKSIRYRDMLAPGYAGRAYVHALAGSADQGLSDVEKALKFDPGNASALETRARILDALGRTD